MEVKELTLENYHVKIKYMDFKEYPETIDGINDQYFKDLLNPEELGLDVRVHITTTLICRCVGINGGIYLPAGVDWWITEFQRIHLSNIADITRSDAIIAAIRHIQSEDSFGKCIIGTAFMYTVMEFYSKYFLGFDPLFDRFDNNLEKIGKYQEVQFSEAIIKLKKQNLAISRELCKIDKFFKQKADIMGLDLQLHNNSYLADRISKNRNQILHGQNVFLHSEGSLLVLLYILYTYCHYIDKDKLEQ